MTVRWITETQIHGVRWLGTPGQLGAAPSVVCKWLPVECENWNEQPPEAQQAILAQAQLLENQYQNQVSSYKAEGGCDATKPGRLAGALKEYLIAKGGDQTKMNLDASVFGPEECAEWLRVFGHPPTIADAKAAKTAKVWNGKTISVSTICGNGVKLPACGGGGPPPPPPPCSDSNPCPADQECVKGECIPKCAPGTVRDPISGECVSGGGVSKAGMGGGGILGVVLLVGAALGAIYFALQAPAGAARDD